MISSDWEWILCDGPECDEKIKNHQWGKVKSEWFMTKDGQHYCPDHIPDWVENWRKRS